MKVRSLALIVATGFLVSGCLVFGSITKNKITTTAPDTAIVVSELCNATYANVSLGSSDQRYVSGCEATGGVTGEDNAAAVDLLKSLLQAK